MPIHTAPWPYNGKAQDIPSALAPQLAKAASVCLGFKSFEPSSL